jgi:hypothetical protein
VLLDLRDDRRDLRATPYSDLAAYRVPG